MGFDLSQLVQNTIAETYKNLGTVNIIVAGKAGVGKSTLINAVFKDNLAETGVGRPITKGIREVSKDGIPVRIIDTQGFEIGEQAQETIQSVQNEIRRRNGEKDPNRHIHVAWLCILEASRRIEKAEEEFVKMLTDSQVPVIAVITQASNDQGFRREVLQVLPTIKNAISVLASPIALDESDHIIQSKNLDKLIDLTTEVIPEAHRNALAAANRVNLKQRLDRSRAAVAAAAASAGVMGAVPIPFSDTVTIIPIQVTMLATISAIWGLPLSKAFLGTLISGTSAGGLGTVVGRTVVGQLLKLIPGAGSIAGGVINATTAAVLTTAFGEAYIRALTQLMKDDLDRDITAEEVRKKLSEELSQTKQIP